MKELHAFLDRSIANWSGLRVLEAGCGSISHIRFGPGIRLAGIDLSANQLERNSGIQTKIVGDIQHYPLPAGQFDMIVCWDVLEHVAEPELAIDNLFSAAAPGGLVILKQPNPLSVKGIMTKLTPHWFHVWVYRHFFKIKNAGTNDVGPFETYMKLAIAPDRLRRYGRDKGMDVAFAASFDAGDVPFFTRRPLLNAVYRFGRLLGRIVSLGRLGDSDHVVVFKKPA